MRIINITAQAHKALSDSAGLNPMRSGERLANGTYNIMIPSQTLARLNAEQVLADLPDTSSTIIHLAEQAKTRSQP